MFSEKLGTWPTVLVYLVWNKTTINCSLHYLFKAKDLGGLSSRVAEDASGVDYHYFRWCFGENLFFRADGSVDPNPIHFWYPWLSESVKSSPILESLRFKPATSWSLDALLRAHTPGTYLILFEILFNLKIEPSCGWVINLDLPFQIILDT